VVRAGPAARGIAADDLLIACTALEHGATRVTNDAALTMVAMLTVTLLAGCGGSGPAHRPPPVVPDSNTDPHLVQAPPQYMGPVKMRSEGGR